MVTVAALVVLAVGGALAAGDPRAPWGFVVIAVGIWAMVVGRRWAAQDLPARPFAHAVRKRGT